MGTIAAIALTDSDAVVHTFSPLGRVGPDLSELASPEGVTPLSDATINAKFSRATVARPTDRTTFNLAVPLYYTDDDGNEAVDDTWRVKVEVVSPRTSTTAVRTINHSLLSQLVASDEFKAYVIDRDPFYG